MGSVLFQRVSYQLLQIHDDKSVVGLNFRTPRISINLELIGLSFLGGMVNCFHETVGLFWRKVLFAFYKEATFRKPLVTMGHCGHFINQMPPSGDFSSAKES